MASSANPLGRLLGGLFGGLLEGLLERLRGGFSRMACWFHYGIESIARDTCGWHMRRPKMYAEDAYLK